MLKDKTKIVNYGAAKGFLLPADILKDSTFPFEEGEELEIEIIDKAIVIRKLQRGD